MYISIYIYIYNYISICIYIYLYINIYIYVFVYASVHSVKVSKCKFYRRHEVRNFAENLRGPCWLCTSIHVPDIYCGKQRHHLLKNQTDALGIFSVFGSVLQKNKRNESRCSYIYHVGTIKNRSKRAPRKKPSTIFGYITQQMNQKALTPTILPLESTTYDQCNYKFLTNQVWSLLIYPYYFGNNRRYDVSSYLLLHPLAVPKFPTAGTKSAG